MAERSFTIDVVTPDRVVVHDQAVSLAAPGVEGSFGILPNHSPFLSELQPGELRYRRDGGGAEVRVAVSGGFLQVFENEVTVLADAAERADEIDVDRARSALERAREAQREAGAAGDVDLQEEARAEEARALNRIRIARG